MTSFFIGGFADKKLRKALPSEELFKQGLYTFDVGQNDIDGAFYSKSEDQVVAFIPTILAEFETGLKVVYVFLISIDLEFATSDLYQQSKRVPCVFFVFRDYTLQELENFGFTTQAL